MAAQESGPKENTARPCWVYRGRRQPEMYLFVGRENGTEQVPAELLERLGPLELAVQFELSPDRTLARADAPAVLAALDERGYYLQLPPPKSS